MFVLEILRTFASQCDGEQEELDDDTRDLVESLRRNQASRLAQLFIQTVWTSDDRSPEHLKCPDGPFGPSPFNTHPVGGGEMGPEG